MACCYLLAFVVKGSVLFCCIILLYCWHILPHLLPHALLVKEGHVLLIDQIFQMIRSDESLLVYLFVVAMRPEHVLPQLPLLTEVGAGLVSFIISFVTGSPHIWCNPICPWEGL